MINVSNRRCRNHLVWASLARWVTRLFTRFKVDVVFLCGSCPGWQRPTDGYVINSTWVIFPLHHTRRLCLRRLMNHFIDVTNISASFLWGEIMVEKWADALCSADDSLEVRHYQRHSQTEETHYHFTHCYYKNIDFSCFKVPRKSSTYRIQNFHAARQFLTNFVLLICLPSFHQILIFQINIAKLN